MGKEEQASPRTAPPSLKLRKKVMSSGSSLVQETADSIDEVVRSQEAQNRNRIIFSSLFQFNVRLYSVLYPSGSWQGLISTETYGKTMNFAKFSIALTGFPAGAGLVKTPLSRGQSLEGLFHQIRGKFEGPRHQAADFLAGKA